jgi:hypothetical protein
VVGGLAAFGMIGLFLGPVLLASSGPAQFSEEHETAGAPRRAGDRAARGRLRRYRRGGGTLFHPSATKTFVSCGFVPLRFDAQTMRLPSRVSIGNPSKSGLTGDRVRPGAVVADQIEVELAPLRVVHVGREDDLAAAAGRKERREVGGAVRRDALVVGAVGVHDADLERPRRVEAAREVLL